MREYKKFFSIIIATLILECLLHYALIQVHMELKYQGQTGSHICNINNTFDCSAVAASSYSEIWGTPVALWGLATNLILLALIAYMVLSHDFQDQGRAAQHSRIIWRTNLLTLSGFIALASIVMGGIAFTQMSVYCIFCLMAYLCSFVVWGGLYSYFPGVSKSNSTPSVQKQKQKHLLGLADFKITFISSIAILFVVFVLKSNIIQSYVPSEVEIPRIIESSLKDWSNNPYFDIKTVQPFIKGQVTPEKAKMRLVEFADYLCPHCAHASSPLEAFVKSHPDVSLEFQAWPLDGECNRSIPSASGVRCALARAAVCGEKLKSSGWETQKWIFHHQEEFSSQEKLESLMKQMITELNWEPQVTAENLKQCMQSDEVRKIIEEQAQLGSQMKIEGTPSIFVNGRYLPGAQMLLVLEKAYDVLKK